MTPQLDPSPVELPTPSRSRRQLIESACDVFLLHRGHRPSRRIRTQRATIRRARIKRDAGGVKEGGR